jgi:hypothetical protein
MEQAQKHSHYELVPQLPVMSNHIISALQQGHQAFPLVKAKTTNGNTYDHTYPFSVNLLVAEPLDYGENLFPLCWHLTHVAFYMFCIYICFVKALT